MNRSKILRFQPILCTLALAGLLGSAVAGEQGRTAEYEVTITNITKGQIFSPPVLATHRSSVSVFNVGEPASEELALVAEAGDGGPLADTLNGLPEVFEAIATEAPVLPGDSLTFGISSGGRFDRVSLVSMLVNTNDAYLALDTKSLPKYRGTSLTYYAIAYDAGSEANNEACAFIPGPACPGDSGNARDLEDAEGYVYVHNGIHGIADLAPASYDWRNPVAKLVIKRLH